MNTNTNTAITNHAELALWSAFLRQPAKANGLATIRIRHHNGMACSSSDLASLFAPAR